MCGFFNGKMKELNIQPSNFSPMHRIGAVLCSPPGAEALCGLCMPPSLSLFELDASSDTGGCIYSANQEHQGMQRELSDRGIEVFNMRQVIGEKLAERENHFKNIGQLRQELESRILQLKNRYGLGKTEEIFKELEVLLNEDKTRYGEDVAVAINATLTNCADLNGKFKKFNPNIPPAANFLFWRDTNHITGDQVRSHKMFWPIRQQEVILAEMGMKAIGIESERMNIPHGSIEGGDVMPIEVNGRRYAFIGRAERTSNEGVEEWFKTHEGLWSQSGNDVTPVVVDGPHQDTQDQMHLDTFFQQVSGDSCIHCGDLTDARDLSILARRGSNIVRVDTIKFSRWINNNFTYPYNMTRDEQLNYAPNILVDAGNTVYITRSGTPNVTRFIENQVTTTIMLGLEHLTKLYGGVHCSTSEIRLQS